MTAVMITLSALLALAMLGSAGWKLTGREHMVESYARVGVPGHRLLVLAALLAAGVGRRGRSGYAGISTARPVI